MLWLWAREYPVTKANGEAEIGCPAAVDIYQWLCEVCSTKLIQSLVILGEPGEFVQVDELLFRHKPKIINKHIKYSTLHNVPSMQHNRGRPPHEQIWVFGLADTSQTPAFDVADYSITCFTWHKSAF